jgi:hypothetical protein
MQRDEVVRVRRPDEDELVLTEELLAPEHGLVEAERRIYGPNQEMDMPKPARPDHAAAPDSWASSLRRRAKATQVSDEHSRRVTIYRDTSTGRRRTV